MPTDHPTAGKPGEELRKRPTRRDLLMVIGQLQGLIGQVGAIAANDRHPHRAAMVREVAAVAHQLCIDARSYDPVIEERGSWGKRPIVRDRV